MRKYKKRQCERQSKYEKRQCKYDMRKYDVSTNVILTHLSPVYASLAQAKIADIAYLIVNKFCKPLVFSGNAINLVPLERFVVDRQKNR